jgi:hypothetical protein
MVWTVPPLPIAALAHTFGQSAAENHHHASWLLEVAAFCLTLRVGVGVGDSGAGRIGWNQELLSVVFPLTCVPPPLPSSSPFLLFRASRAAHRGARRRQRPLSPERRCRWTSLAGRLRSPDGTSPSTCADPPLRASAISQAACYNAAMVYVPVAMLRGAEDDDSMFVEPFHRGAWLRLAKGARVSRLPVCRWTAMPCLRMAAP